jgi:DNA ligase-1
MQRKLNTIYKKTKIGKVQEWTIEVEENRYRTISGQIDGIKTTSEWTVVEGKNTGRSNETSANEQAYKEAIAKRDLKLQRGYFEDISQINKKQYFEPMLATKWEDRKAKIKYPIFSQPKLDGIRCIVTEEGMFTRNGKEILSAPHIRESLEDLFKQDPDLILDGELYADKYANDFNKIVSLVKKTKPTKEDLEQSKLNIEYHIYDLPSLDANFIDRIWDLQSMEYSFIGTRCKLVPTYILYSEQEVQQKYEEYIEEGYEGQMLRTDGLYENKRSKNLMKHKSFQDQEFTILGIFEGEGNKTGTVGYMTFEIEGKPFKSNVKCTREEGAQIWNNREKLIGKTATVKYFELTPAGIPRFPYVINIDRESYE